MLGYAIFNINITNPENYKEYIEKVVKVTEKFDGKYIVSGGTTSKIEGTFPHPRTVSGDTISKLLKGFGLVQ